jgi:tRNA threonylcarbamoyladenosine biosynthesis protein TsaB
MALILNIDTATETASVSLAEDGHIARLVTNAIQKEHASFLHIAIQEVLQQSGKKMTDMDAIAVTAGPGSYTGLRVGMASAKGLAYALGKPFITLGTLEMIAGAAFVQHADRAAWYCPMIDARRMEVYTAAYDASLKEIAAPYALILNEQSFLNTLNDKKMIFAGSGTGKFKKINNHPNAYFVDEISLPEIIVKASLVKLLQKDFTELAHSQPLYVKEFHDGN